MMNVKKIAAILLAMLLLVSFGCSRKVEAPAAEAIVSTEPKAEVAAPEEQKVELEAAPANTEAPAAAPVDTEAPAEAPAEPEAQEGAFTVTDMMNREITFAKPVEKAVALTASDCEIIFALGAEEALVGRGEYCDYPPEAAEIPAVSSGADTNVEQIIALEPDVVFMTTMAQSPEQIEQLEKAGIRVVVSDAQDIEGTYAYITLIGEVMGKQDNAQKIIEEMKNAFAEIKDNALEEPRTIYFEIYPQWTAGKGTFMNEVAEMMGLKNCFDDVEGWAQISDEQVIERNPDYILTISLYSGEGPTPEQEIMDRAGWEKITAVQNENVLNLPNNELSRPVPRLVEGAQQLFDFVVESEEAMKPAA